jgi:hypothetical protein
MQMDNRRVKQNWMGLNQSEINLLSIDDWEHYSGGGCLCHAHSSGECCCGSCGSWDIETPKLIFTDVQFPKSNIDCWEDAKKNQFMRIDWGDR